VEANLRAATARDAAGRVINIGTGGEVTLNALLRSMCRIFNRKFDPGYEQARAGDIRHSVALTRLAGEVLDWQATVGMDEGLDRLLQA
jgi:UDP-glucose 4-epimerase